jgi:uncharacterized protein (TIGR02145 family)
MKSLFTINLFLALILISSCKKDHEENKNPTDIDGNTYQTVTIGNQVWMAENLKVTRYRNGDVIPNVTVNATWISLTTGALCDYGNTEANSAVYGKLYNWYAVNDSRNIAPVGWHVATDGDWMTLFGYLGGGSVAGAKLKETGTTHWNNPNKGATNESGFKALGAGIRTYSSTGNFEQLKTIGAWWSTASYNALNTWNYQMFSTEIYTVIPINVKTEGFSVRCVKD